MYFGDKCSGSTRVLGTCRAGSIPASPTMDDHIDDEDNDEEIDGLDEWIAIIIFIGLVIFGVWVFCGYLGEFLRFL